MSKEQLEVALRPSGEQFSLPNDARALRILVKRLLPLKCARIVVEATGGYSLCMGSLRFTIRLCRAPPARPRVLRQRAG